MTVPILKQGNYLIATVQSALADRDLSQLRDDLAERVGRFRSRGVIVDVTALDVMDSFAVRTLRGMAQLVRLRGAEPVIVGLQPGSLSRWCGSAWNWGMSRPPWIWRRGLRCCGEGSKKAATGEEADKLVPRLACLERSLQAALRVRFPSRVKPELRTFLSAVRSGTPRSSRQG